MKSALRWASLIADANGDLFGTTEFSGPGGFGTVCELVKTTTGYAGTPIKLAGVHDIGSHSGLIADANGDLFGTNETVGASGEGSVLRSSGLLPAMPARRPSVCVCGVCVCVPVLTAPTAATPLLGVIDDAKGNLFGTTQSGVFEITNSGFATTATVAPPAIVTGNILWQNKSTGQASFWEMDESALVGGGPVTPNPGTSFHAVGTGDFNDDGKSDILWQNTNTGQASIWEMNGSSLIRGRVRDAQSGADFSRGWNGRFQRRRLFRHSLAEHEHRAGLDLGNAGDHAQGRRARDAQSGLELSRGWNRRFESMTGIPT